MHRLKAYFNTLLRRFFIWRLKHVNQHHFTMVLSVLIGFLAGLAAVFLKRSVHFVQHIIEQDFLGGLTHVLYFLLPLVGISLAVIFIRLILKREVGHGVPSVLYALSKKQGKIHSSNTFSSIITSSLTVGFGGSVGLEGPALATGAAWGSNMAQWLRVDYKQLVILLGAASAGALAAIFKAPIAAIVFAMEVIMIDLTAASVAPLILASITAVLTSMAFLGNATIYQIDLQEHFTIKEIPYYIVLGIFSGFMSVYFTRVYMYINNRFESIKNIWKRLLIGGLLLGLLILLFPSLYGEGFQAINGSLHGDISFVFKNTFYEGLSDNFIYIMIFMALILLFKVIATAITFGAGGVGGIFAPSLFLGSNLGLLFALMVNYFNVGDLNNNHFAFAGMAGLIAGNLHAPLTGIFLIGDITGGYQMFIPLMIVSVVSYTTVKLFQPNSVYTIQLAKRGELLTHNSDQNILKLMSINRLIERNFLSIDKNATLGDLVKVISKSSRNIFPVIDEDNHFEGLVVLDHVREIMFDKDQYDKVKVSDVMIVPDIIIETSETMGAVANKFHESRHYNLPVIEQGKYVGFVSRANVFSKYRRMLKHFSAD